jgi:hypothetical protein
METGRLRTGSTVATDPAGDGLPTLARRRDVGIGDVARRRSGRGWPPTPTTDVPAPVARRSPVPRPPAEVATTVPDGPASQRGRRSRRDPAGAGPSSRPRRPVSNVWRPRAKSASLVPTGRASRRGRRLAAIRQVPAPSPKAWPPVQPAGDGLQIFGLNQISRDRGRDEPEQYVPIPPNGSDHVQVLAHTAPASRRSPVSRSRALSATGHGVATWARGRQLFPTDSCLASSSAIVISVRNSSSIPAA